MAAAGAVVAEALRAVVECAKPGMTTADLDHVAADVLARHGATSPFLNYHPRWAPTPVSGGAVRERQRRRRARHPQRLRARRRRPGLGRLRRHPARLDRRRGAQLHRRHPAPGDAALIEAADAALAAGIAAVRPGNTLGDVGHAIALGGARRGLRPARRPRRPRHRAHHARGPGRARTRADPARA